jgi:hypothetical protein
VLIVSSELSLDFETLIGNVTHSTAFGIHAKKAHRDGCFMDAGRTISIPTIPIADHSQADH